MQNRFINYTDNQLVELFRVERKKETSTSANIILLITEIERRRFYMDTQSSLYAFLKENFQYTKDEAYPRIKAAKAYAIEPSVEQALRSGQTCITHMKDAYVAIVSENKRRKKSNEPRLTIPDQQALIRKIIVNRESAKTIADAFPKLKPVINDDQPIADGHRKITMSAPDNTYARFTNFKCLVSKKLPMASGSKSSTKP